MRVKGNRLAAAIALIGAAAFARADDPAPEVREFLKSWAAKMRDVRSLRVEFTQTKELKILRRPLVSHGRALLKGKKLLMTIDSASGERETELQVDVDKGEARMYYPRLARVEVIEIGKSGSPPGSTPFPIFGGDVEALPETNATRLEGTTLVLVPRDAESQVAEMRMEFKDGQIVGVAQKNKKGDALSIKIERFDKNADVSDKDVELAIPDGTKVVKMFGGASK